MSIAVHRRLCDGGWKHGCMGRHGVPVFFSSYICQRRFASWTSDIGRCGFHIELAHSGGNTCTLWQSRRSCVVPLLKVVVRRSALGMKILRSTYSWTHHHWRTYGDSFLKALPKNYVFLLLFVLCGGCREAWGLEIAFFLSV
jgi:hypothetical protein